MTSVAPSTPPRRPELPIWLPVGAAWATYLPLSWQYLFFLGSGLAAIVLLARAGHLIEACQATTFRLALAFWGWMLLAATWSAAAPREIGTHLWHYSLPLWLAVLTPVLAPAHARLALRHFIAVSAVVAVLLPTPLLAERITGNQRIEYSLLLALAAGFALIEAFAPALQRHRRAFWAGAAVVCTVGLALQDRRTGMLALPLLLGAWVWVRQRRWQRRLALLALLVLAAGLAWQASPSVRARFAEGVAELRQYQSQGAVETSWGMRLRMLEHTSDMVRDKPWFGHGTGGWLEQWRRRVGEGDALLQVHTTPHNEYLLITVQGGAVALVLFLVALGAHGVATWRNAIAGDRPQAWLVWVAFGFTALFNVALRDAKLALPLLLLGALAWAAARDPAPD